MLSGLVYVSSAITPFSPTELAALLDTSRRNNVKRRITGLLLYIGGNFMQALEGEEQAVDELYWTIAEDPRHRSLVTVIRSPVRRRLFPDWAMGFREVECLPPETRARVSTFIQDAQHGLIAPQSCHLARRLLRTFAVTMR
jgi:hypothetical protein